MNKTPLYFRINKFNDQIFCLDDMTNEELRIVMRLALTGLKPEGTGRYSWDCEFEVVRVLSPEEQQQLDDAEQNKNQLNALIKAAVDNAIGQVKEDTSDA